MTQRTYTVYELARIIEGEVKGDGTAQVSVVATLEEADAGSVALLLDKRKYKVALQSRATAVIAPRDFVSETQTVIQVQNPRAVMPEVLGLFEPRGIGPQSIHKTACIADTARIGSNVSIGAYAVIGEHCEIGDGTVVYPQSTIGAFTRIGKNGLIYSGVHIYHHCQIGDRVILHSGAVVGSDGFGFVPEGKNWCKVPQIGKVILGNNVEIGANSTIDRGAIGDTVIADGTKVDNLVHIAHNVKIGTSCAIAGQVGFAGSTVLGDNVSIGGQAGLGGHLTVGSGTTIMGKAGVTKDIPDNMIVSGFPARDHKEEMLFMAALRKVPELIKLLKERN